MRLLVLLAAFIFVACEATDEPAATHKPMADLAVDKREVIAAFREGGVEWELMRDKVKHQPELANFVVDNMIDQMLRSYKRAQVSHAGTSTGPFERARVELFALSQYSAPVLAEMLDADVSDAVVAYLAGDVLCLIGADARPYLMPKLDSENAETRRRVLAVLANLELVPSATDTAVLFSRVVALAHSDEEWLVRAEAAATLGAIGPRMAKTKPAREALIQCLLDGDADVRQSAELALGALGDARSFPILIEVLAREITNGAPRNMAAARRSLLDLASDPSLEQRGRSFSIRDWQAYWREHRERLLRPPTRPEKR